MPLAVALLIAGLGATPAVAQIPDMPATAFDEAAAAREAVAAGHRLIAVPSGKTVWLDEIRADRMPGIGSMERLRFVMPSLAAQVPETAGEPAPEGEPLSPDDEAALNDGSLVGTLSTQGSNDIQIAPADGIHGEIPAAPGQDQLIPDSNFAGDVPAPPPGTEASADTPVAVPAAPDLLMQDPNHNDAVWLCENIALPRLATLRPRPAQVVISLASAPTPFGSFDPSVVQLFEAFSIPPDRDACLWEPW